MCFWSNDNDWKLLRRLKSLINRDKCQRLNGITFYIKFQGFAASQNFTIKPFMNYRWHLLFRDSDTNNLHRKTTPKSVPVSRMVFVTS